MYAYLVYTYTSDQAAFDHVFGSGCRIGQMQQDHNMVVYSVRPFHEIVIQAATLPKLPEGAHRFDVVPLGPVSRL